MDLKLISWNVNGVRAVVKSGFEDFLRKTKPDVVGLQEIKMNDKAREKEEFDFKGYEEYWNPARRPGYSGTAILVKNEKSIGAAVVPGLTRDPGTKVLSYKTGMGTKVGDEEGRVQTLEFEKFYFVNAYFPNANHELSRLDYKMKFNKAFLSYVKKLEKRKPVVTCGDFNVAHEEIDIARPKDNAGHAGFTDEERRDMTRFLKSGLVDSFRLINGDKVQYSWWSYRTFARDRGIGWRIDYFLASDVLEKNIKDAFIQDDIFGSDHCPVGIILKI